MKRKLFTLLTLLLCVCGGAWGVDYATTPLISADFSSMSDGTPTAISGLTYHGASISSGKLTWEGNFSEGSRDVQVTFTVSTTACKLVLGHVTSSSSLGIKGKLVQGSTPISDFSSTAWSITKGETVDEKEFKGLTAGTYTLKLGPAGSSTRSIITSIAIYEEDAAAPTQVATPTISAESFSGASQEVTISCETTGATIHYTLDGTEPSSLSPTYNDASKPIISSTTTVKAIAVDGTGGLEDSEVATATIKKVISTTWGSWDFTNWSSATLTGIGEDDTNWSKYEKYDSSKDVESSDLSEKVWTNKVAVNGTLKFGETTIPETSELQFNIATHTLGVTYNQSSTDIAPGGYHGSKYLWLYSSNAKLIIPNVPAGATIKIGVESHKLNGTDDATRTLTVTNTNEGTIATEAYIEATFTVSSTGNVQISPSKGMHIYYITVTANAETVPVSTLSGRNYASYVTTDKLDFGNTDGITAYIATGFNGAKNAIVLQSVDVVDAATPIIVKTATQGATVNVPVTTAAASSTTENDLVAGDGTTKWNGTVGYTYYYIASDQFHKATSGTLQSGKAYLMVDNDDVPAAARAFGFVFEDEGEVTGIHSVSNSVLTTDQVFDLQGRRVAQPTKGLYIMNGRKVIFK